jgi:PAS domain S-box-containing protein
MNGEMTKILLIEDNPWDARLIREMLNRSKSDPFELDCVGHLHAGLTYLDEGRPDIILLDLGLPDSQGLNTLTKLNDSIMGIPVVVLTGLDDEATGKAAVLQSAQDYLLKGQIDGRSLWRAISHSIERTRVDAELNFRSQLLDNATDSIFVHDFEGDFYYLNKAAYETLGYQKEELMALNLCQVEIEPFPRHMDPRIEELDEADATFTSVHRCKNGAEIPVEIHAHILKYKEKKYVVSVVRDITERKRAEVSLEQSFDKLQTALKGSISIVSKIVEMRDPYTAGHEQRVAKLCSAIARQMEMPDEQIEYLALAAAVHDVGKMYVPPEILSKSNKLSDLEVKIIRTHAQGSYDILSTVEFPWPIAQIVGQHHERMDGSGYPNRLKGEDILLEARILAVADVVEAMNSDRPYRAALGQTAALEEISGNRGRLYDARVVDACLAVFRIREFQY